MKFTSDISILCKDNRVHPSQPLQCCVRIKRYFI